MANKGLYELFLKLAAQETDNCIVWEHNTSGGYGVLWINNSAVRVHRLAYEQRVGPIPEGKLLLHSCDNRPCLNYRHLAPGTCKENTQDAKSKGRLRAGYSPQVLTEQQVLEIRASYHRGVAGSGQYSLAKRFGVSPNLIRGIIAGRKWKRARGFEQTAS